MKHRTFSQKLSTQFDRMALHLGLSDKRAKSKPPQDYSYLKTHDPQVMAAHGLSLHHNRHMEEAVFHSEHHRRAAEILHDLRGGGANDNTGNNHLVAAMLLQDLVHYKPVDPASKEVTHYEAVSKLFDNNAMMWTQEYKTLAELPREDMLEHLEKRSLPGTRCMQLATMIEYMEYNLQQTKERTYDFYQRTHNETEGAVLRPEDFIKMRRESYLRSLTMKEHQLDLRQQEFEAVKGTDRDMDLMFMKHMDEFRKHIRAWKVDNGYSGNTKKHPPRLPPGSISM